MDAEAQRKLLALHEQLGKEAEALIAGDRINEAQKDMVRKISGLASRNYIQMQKAAQTYLGGKNLFLPHRSYAQNRINAAKAAVEFGKGTAVREEELQIASRNEHRAQERVQDALGKQLEQNPERQSFAQTL